jgi:hypothetical protein
MLPAQPLRPDSTTGHLRWLIARRHPRRRLNHPFRRLRRVDQPGINRESAKPVTINGTIGTDAGFTPDRIADTFWTVHAQPADHWQTEIVFNG